MFKTLCKTYTKGNPNLKSKLLSQIGHKSVIKLELLCSAGLEVKMRAKKEPINAQHTSYCRCILISRARLSVG